MRYALIATWLLLCSATPALAQLSITFGAPGVSIGINLPVYPTLQRIPGYPVYYAPGLDSNYFFYDGLYWVYDQDNWYASSWYNGPWTTVDRFDVPYFVLRVPVRYYRHAPSYFHGWRADAPPRWGEHWGESWEQRHRGWDQWNRSSAPAPAPLPTFQRQYYGERYPQPSQQVVIQTRNYRYQPRDAVARQHYEYQKTQVAPAPQPQAPRQQQQQAAPQPQAPPQQQQQAAPTQQAPRQQQQQAAPVQQAPRQQQQQAAPQPPAQERQAAPQQRTAQPQRQPAQQEQAARQQQQPSPKPEAANPPQGQAARQPPQQAPAAREQQAPPKGQESAPAKGQDKGQGEAKGKGHEKDGKGQD